MLLADAEIVVDEARSFTSSLCFSVFERSCEEPMVYGENAFLMGKIEHFAGSMEMGKILCPREDRSDDSVGVVCFGEPLLLLGVLDAVK